MGDTRPLWPQQHPRAHCHPEFWGVVGGAPPSSWIAVHIQYRDIDPEQLVGKPVSMSFLSQLAL